MATTKFEVYGYKGGARRYYGVFETRAEAERVALWIAETALNEGSRAPAVVVDPVEVAS